VLISYPSCKKDIILFLLRYTYAFASEVHCKKLNDNPMREKLALNKIKDGKCY